jgi:hypothetical protein
MAAIVNPGAAAGNDLLEFEVEARALQCDAAALAELRDLHMCGAQSISYRSLGDGGGSEGGALCIVRGDGQYLFDASGEKYLDTRNNVGHVGWQNPAVTGAITRQIQATNSNTRYAGDELCSCVSIILLVRSWVLQLLPRVCVCVFHHNMCVRSGMLLLLQRVCVCVFVCV